MESLLQNYAGDLRRSSTAATLARIDSIFGQCRAFRDTPSIKAKSGPDFANFVLFCAKHGSAWRFREPVEGDFLQSQARRQSIPPSHELPLSSLIETVDLEVGLRENRAEAVDVQSVMDHWRIMRKVLPDVVWENW